MTPNTRRILLIAAVGVLVVGALAWSFWPRPVEVELGSVSRGPMQVDVSDEGRTRVREIYQVSAPVNGRLLRVEVHPGDVVEGGKTRVAELLPIAPSFLDVRTRAQAESAVGAAQAARNLAAAEVTRAKAELAFATSELKRAEALSPSGSISKAGLERAQLAHDTAVAQLATAQAALRVKDSDLSAARALLIDPTGEQPAQAGIPIIAPVSGRVLRVPRESEAVLAAGTTILEVGDSHQLEIVADLISEDAVKVREGDAATITDWGGSGALNARVRRIEPSGFTKVSALGVEEQRVNILLDFTDPPSRWSQIADGFRVLVHITVWHSPAALRVPVAAMFRQGRDWAVFTVKDGRATRTTIKVGPSNDDVADVLSGLTEGMQVVLHPSDRISEGTRVTPRALQ
ncbi:MAG TPA: HlyD family efflux transporter periplasmic adaptor subunit [Rhizomicrobium sp.]|nr:HlyD family efflux transporter periplasmic adaptor subunit [Rhizomicrobium sp.]